MAERGHFDPPPDPNKALFSDVDYEASLGAAGDAVVDFGVTTIESDHLRRVLSSEGESAPSQEAMDSFNKELGKKTHLKDIISGKNVAGVVLTAGAAVFFVGAAGYEAYKHNEPIKHKLRRVLHIPPHNPENPNT